MTTFLQFCWSSGGYLGELVSQEQEESLDSVLMRGVHYWIGLNDMATEGRFVWAESHQVPSS